MNPATRKHKEAALSFLVAFIVMMVICLLLLKMVSGFDFQGDERAAAINELKRELPALADGQLLRLRSEQPGQKPLDPSLVYEGKTAIVILRDEEVMHDAYGIFQVRESLKYELLARTPAGRYFSVSYRLRLDDVRACQADPESCLGWVFRPVDKEEAMVWVFRDKRFTPERFRSAFGVDPPSVTASIPA